MVANQYDPEDAPAEPSLTPFKLGTVYLTDRARYILQSTGRNVRDELRKHLGSPFVAPPAPRRTHLLLPNEDLRVATYPGPRPKTMIWSMAEQEPQGATLTNCKSFDGATIA